MIEKKIPILNKTGLHTRPANKFVKEAKKYDCTITVTKGEKQGNAKSLIKILKLGIIKGDTISLSCEGEDENAAMEGLMQVIKSLEV